MCENYKKTKAWRLSNPDKRSEQRKRYYRQTAFAKNDGKPWNPTELRMVIEHSVTDKELSAKIGRSVQAIQKQRCISRSKLKPVNDGN